MSRKISFNKKILATVIASSALTGLIVLCTGKTAQPGEG